MAEMFLRTLTMIKRYVVLGTGLSLLTGCAMSYISPDCPETLIPDYSSEVTVGQMERAAVRGVLGTPQFSSTYWGFDLFRADTEQAEVVFAVTPWPIPFARIKDQFHRYTLVAYDANGRVQRVGKRTFSQAFIVAQSISDPVRFSVIAPTCWRTDVSLSIPRDRK